MATYSKKDYTPEQLKVIFAKTEEGKRLYKKMQLKDKSMDGKSYDKIQEIKAEKLEIAKRFAQVKKELNEALNARTVFDNDIRIAKEALDRAEASNNIWGFQK